MSTENSLAHTKWECKYHVVFAPKLSEMEINRWVPGFRNLFALIEQTSFFWYNSFRIKK